MYHAIEYKKMWYNQIIFVFKYHTLVWDLFVFDFLRERILACLWLSSFYKDLSAWDDIYYVWIYQSEAYF